MKTKCNKTEFNKSAPKSLAGQFIAQRKLALETRRRASLCVPLYATSIHNSTLATDAKLELQSDERVPRRRFSARFCTSSGSDFPVARHSTQNWAHARQKANSSAADFLRAFSSTSCASTFVSLCSRYSICKLGPRESRFVDELRALRESADFRQLLACCAASSKCLALAKSKQCKAAAT